MRHERGGARGIVRDARALHAKHKGQPARGDREAAAGGGVDAAAGGRVRKHGLPVVGSDADEHPERAGGERGAPERRAMQRLVAALEQQPLLRVHRERFGGRDGKRPGVEGLDVWYASGVRGRAALVVAQRCDLARGGIKRPAGSGDLPDGVAARVEHRRDLPDAAGATWPTSEQTADGHRGLTSIAPRDSSSRIPARRATLRADEPLDDVPRDGARRRVVEHVCRRELNARLVAQARRELGGGERVDPRLHERRVCVKLARVGA
mmetsp:Transcript_40554/g.130763  ORF Transcript_40554/g.130763 Transcript_40554/m.130763 type:complete len:265 (+) Transcript_40554:472-1266(+)